MNQTLLSLVLYALRIISSWYLRSVSSLAFRCFILAPASAMLLLYDAISSSSLSISFCRASILRRVSKRVLRLCSRLSRLASSCLSIRAISSSICLFFSSCRLMSCAYNECAADIRTSSMVIKCLIFCRLLSVSLLLFQPAPYPDPVFLHCPSRETPDCIP